MRMRRLLCRSLGEFLSNSYCSLYVPTNRVVCRRLPTLYSVRIVVNRMIPTVPLSFVSNQTEPVTHTSANVATNLKEAFLTCLLRKGRRRISHGMYQYLANSAPNPQPSSLTLETGYGGIIWIVIFEGSIPSTHPPALEPPLLNNYRWHCGRI